MLSIRFPRSNIEENVEQILEEARERVGKLAEEYRERVLLPLCREHKLTYIAGMGRTVFYVNDNERESMGSIDDAVLMGYGMVLDTVFKDINVPVMGTNDCFGYYIKDITKKDIGLSSRRRR